MVPRRLKQARKAARLTQEKLGVMAGMEESVARTRVSYYESGTNAPNFEIACRMAQALNIPVPYLYTPDDEMAEKILELYHSKDSWGQ